MVESVIARKISCPYCRWMSQLLLKCQQCNLWSADIANAAHSHKNESKMNCLKQCFSNQLQFSWCSKHKCIRHQKMHAHHLWHLPNSQMVGQCSSFQQKRGGCKTQSGTRVSNLGETHVTEDFSWMLELWNHSSLAFHGICGYSC